MGKITLIFVFITFFTAAIFAQNDYGCPTLRVTGPSEAIKLGETATFSASLFGNYDEKKVRYKWFVDKGKIIEGQGTTLISVSTIGLEDTTITVAVEVTGLPCGNLIEYETTYPDESPQIILVDHFAIR